MKRIVIIGAGATGLGAAKWLSEVGECEVTVVEAAPAVGGLAATVRCEDVATDLGPHRVYTELDEVRELLPDLLGDDLFRVRRSSRMWLDGHWIAYPLRLRQLVRTLGIRTILHFGASLLAARMRKLPSPQGEPTFEGVMKRAYGAAAYGKVFGPYARKVWRLAPSELSAEIARVRLPQQQVGASFGPAPRGRLLPGVAPLREFFYVRGGIGQLCEKLADRIRQRGGRILLQSPAVALKMGETGVTGVVVQQSDATHTLDADAVISTVPLPVLKEMLPSDVGNVEAAFSKLEYLSIILVVLVLAKDRVGPDHWLYFPQEPLLPTRVCEPKNFDDSLAPSGKTCLCCEITVRNRESLYHASDERLASQIERDLAATGLFARQEVVSQFAIRKDWAYPLYRLGFEKALATIWSSLGRIPNLVTAGRQGLFAHNNIDHSLAMGQRAAMIVWGFDAPASVWYAALPQFAHFRIID